MANDYIEKIKNIHQFQFGFIYNDEAKHQYLQTYLKEIYDEENNENNKLIIERYEAILIEKNNIFNNFLYRVYNELYIYDRCTQIQLFINTPITDLEKGSYYVNYPKVYETGYYEDEISQFFDDNEIAMVIVCCDLKYINFLGRNGYARALKQAGEIRQILKSSMNYSIQIKNNINFNAFSHAIGINVNSLLILDVISLKILANN